MPWIMSKRTIFESNDTEILYISSEKEHMYRIVWLFLLPQNAHYARTHCNRNRSLCIFIHFHIKYFKCKLSIAKWSPSKIRMSIYNILLAAFSFSFPFSFVSTNFSEKNVGKSLIAYCISWRAQLLRKVEFRTSKF